MFARMNAAVGLLIALALCVTAHGQGPQVITYSGMPVPAPHSGLGDFAQIGDSYLLDPTISDEGEVLFIAWTREDEEAPQVSHAWKSSRFGDLIPVLSEGDTVIEEITECQMAWITATGFIIVGVMNDDADHAIAFEHPDHGWWRYANCYSACRLAIGDHFVVDNCESQNCSGSPNTLLCPWWGPFYEPGFVPLYDPITIGDIEGLPENTYLDQERVSRDYWADPGYGIHPSLEGLNHWLFGGKVVPAPVFNPPVPFDVLVRKDVVSPGEILFRSGDLAPGVPVRRFEQPWEIGVNVFSWASTADVAQGAFVAWIDSNPQVQGLWKIESWVTMDVSKVFVQGEEMPGLPLTSILSTSSALANPVMNSVGDIAVACALTPTEPEAPQWSVYLYRNGEFGPIAYDGQVADLLTPTGTVRIKFDDLPMDGVAMNSLGDVAFRAYIGEVDENDEFTEDPKVALLLYRDGSDDAALPFLRLIAKTGDAISLPGLGNATLYDLRMVAGSGGDDGRRRSMNAMGDLAFWFSTLDASGAHYGFARWTAGCSDCPADFNCSGGTPDDSDIAAFLSAYYAGDPRADINHSGGTPDDSDVSAFFDHYTEGC